MHSRKYLYSFACWLSRLVGFTLTVKLTGLAIPNHTFSVLENCTASCVVTGHLVTLHQVRTKFITGDHDMILQEGHREIWCRNVHNAQVALEEAIAFGPTLEAR